MTLQTMIKKPETVKQEDLIERKDGLMKKLKQEIDIVLLYLKLKKKFNKELLFFFQQERTETSINKVVGNQVFLNTSYTRTILHSENTKESPWEGEFPWEWGIPVFSLKRFETDSIVYELLGDSKKTPSKRTNRDQDWQNLHFKRLEGNTECFYKQNGHTASWLFCDINHKEGTFDLSSKYIGDKNRSDINEFQDEGDYESIINTLEWLKTYPTRVISGKIKNNSIDPDSCRISKEECIWYLIPPSNINKRNLLRVLRKNFFKWEHSRTLY